MSQEETTGSNKALCHRGCKPWTVADHLIFLRRWAERRLRFLSTIHMMHYMYHNISSITHLDSITQQDQHKFSKCVCSDELLGCKSTRSGSYGTTHVWHLLPGASTTSSERRQEHWACNPAARSEPQSLQCWWVQHNPGGLKRLRLGLNRAAFLKQVQLRATKKSILYHSVNKANN